MVLIRLLILSIDCYFHSKSYFVIYSYHFTDTSTQKVERVEKKCLKHTLQLHTRAVMWSSVMDDEAHYVKLIALIIDAEISHTTIQEDIDIGSTSLLSMDNHIDVTRQAVHAYHVLYCGVLDEVVAKQSGNPSLSGR